MRIIRSYPQPDSPAPNIGPRERALAVFKYLLGLEPEAAVLHPLFACIGHSYEQHGKATVNEICQGDALIDTQVLNPSIVPMLTSDRELVAPAEQPEDSRGL